MTLLDRVRQVLPINRPANAGDSLAGMTGVGAAANFTDARYKAIIPNFLYKPPYGYPLSKNVPELRRLARSPFVAMITNTATAEVSSLDWSIKARDGQEVPEEIIEKTKEWFYNPNRNNESIKFIIEAIVRDVLEIDAGVVVKVKDLKGDLKEIYARDGGLFNKNPDIYGVLPDEGSGVPAYYQYGWLTGARPIPFGRDEVVYFMNHPRSDSIYGLSSVEVLENTLQLLIYGIDSNLEYFTDNQVPKGILSMVGATSEDVKAFQSVWAEVMKKKGSDGKWRKDFHKMPIINTEGEFKNIGFSNVELELLEQQKWFTKLVWACYGITPSELGFTEDSNKATEVIQSSVAKRKLINPLVTLLEYHFNTEIVNDLPWIKGKYEDKVVFEFDKFDIQEEMGKRQLFGQDIKLGVRTVNEVREELNLEPLSGGDVPRGARVVSDSTSNAVNNFGKSDSTSNIINGQKEDEVVRDKKSFEKKNLTNVKALMSSNNISLKEFEFIAKDNLSDLEKFVLDLTRKELRDKIEIKALDSKFIKDLVKKIDLDKIKNNVNSFVKKSFFNGLEKVDSNKLNKNIVPDYDAIQFLSNYTFDNVKGLESDLKNDVRQVLQRGLIDGKPYKDISKDVKKVFDVGENRALAIARTEEQRAMVQGELIGYKQAGVKMNKTWVATIDDKTSPICKALNGTTIPLNESFEYKGEYFSGPPSHVNCRSVLTYEVVE